MNNVYSFVSPRPVRMGPPPAPVTSPLCVFAVYYNGHPVEIDGVPVEHNELWAACHRIDQLAATFGTSVGCFRVNRVWL